MRDGAIPNTGAVWGAVHAAHEGRARSLPPHVRLSVRWCDLEQAWDVLAEHKSALAWDKIRALTSDLHAGVKAVLDQVEAAGWASPDQPRQGNHREAIAGALAGAPRAPAPPERLIYGRGRDGRRYLVHTRPEVRRGSAPVLGGTDLGQRHRP